MKRVRLVYGHLDRRRLWVLVRSTRNLGISKADTLLLLTASTAQILALPRAKVVQRCF
jgi:hypothetical protein